MSIPKRLSVPKTVPYSISRRLTEMKKIDINCDLGESFGAYSIGKDAEVIPLISSANIACGWHGGDAVVMSETVAEAAAANVAVGAHPGYPDLVGFGRRNLKVTPKELKAYIQYQVGALTAFCRANRIPLCHVKPHGAMYNMAAVDINLARAVCEGVASVSEELILLALSGSEMCRAAEQMGIRCAREVFADRAYEDDGTLVARSKPGAVITDKEAAVQRIVRLVRTGKVESISGKEIEVGADSICVHGDNLQALEFVREIRKALTEAGIEIAPLAETAGV